MDLSRETWAALHGLVLGVLLLLAFAGGLAGLWGLRPGLITTAGIRTKVSRLYWTTSTMAVVAWFAVISGTWLVYPWYRAGLAEVGGDPYAGCVGAAVPSATCSPRDFLKSEVSGTSAAWHEFGMEWKEHIAWVAPILATAAAFLVIYYGPRLIARTRLRTAVLTMFVAAFAAALVAGVIGSFLGNVAPVA